MDISTDPILQCFNVCNLPCAFLSDGFKSQYLPIHLSLGLIVIIDVISDLINVHLQSVVHINQLDLVVTRIPLHHAKQFVPLVQFTHTISAHLHFVLHDIELFTAKVLLFDEPFEGVHDGLHTTLDYAADFADLYKCIHFIRCSLGLQHVYFIHVLLIETFLPQLM